MQLLNISPDLDQLNISLAAAMVAELERVEAAGMKPLTLAISGGRTPLGLLAHLVENYSHSPIWKQLDLLWVDERHVPFDDPDSNYGNARPFIEALGIRPNHIHPMGRQPDTALAAREYHEFLIQLGSQRPQGVALFDLMLLGLGPDGHVASLFPGTEHTQDIELCKATIQPESGQARISLTLAALNSTNCCIFMASGVGKADIISRVYQALPNPELPASLIAPRHKPIWFIDRVAASLL
ncbi:MAG: 6-phosphogluconolactonase [Candidatus Marinimicrobia bacterium]|nr:6-phosphogluconolactonase [FCB group bacterium]MBL7023930.1 6-phosphogluconolactonase [Candidatus Neomarinimicrobiota bacterium]